MRIKSVGIIEIAEAKVLVGDVIHAVSKSGDPDIAVPVFEQGGNEVVIQQPGDISFSFKIILSGNTGRAGCLSTGYRYQYICG